MGLPEMIKQLYAVTDEELCGYHEADIDFVKNLCGTLPETLETFWHTTANTQALHQVQDYWISPQDYRDKDWLEKCGYLVVLVENQGVCTAGIRKEDLGQADPPVYVSMDDKNWTLCAGSVSEFLQAALSYEAVFAFEYHPDDFVYWLTEEELKVIQSYLEKRPYQLHGWLDMDLRFYSNSYDHMVAVMDCGDLEMIYGAASEKAYQKLIRILDGIGEA